MLYLSFKSLPRPQSDESIVKSNFSNFMEAEFG